MVSVCMATKDGAAYIREQIDSILMQLDASDELIISDDASTDETIAIVHSYADSRIRLIQNHKSKGVTRNFEASLMASKGNYIFLSDQDDVWVPLKIKTMLHHLQRYDLVVSDCLVVDHTLKTKNTSFFNANKSGRGLLRNILKNSYMGCCMAFNRKLLMRALPFPHDIPIHDFWIGLIGEVHFNVKFLPEMLVYHRRHFSNTSSTGEHSPLSFQQKLAGRYHIIKNLFLHRSYAE